MHVRITSESYSYMLSEHSLESTFHFPKEQLETGPLRAACKADRVYFVSYSSKVEKLMRVPLSEGWLTG